MHLHMHTHSDYTSATGPCTGGPGNHTWHRRPVKLEIPLHEAPGLFCGHRQHQVREGPSQTTPHQGGGRGVKRRHIHHEVAPAPAPAHSLAVAPAPALRIHLRLHIFIDTKETCQVFLNITPGTIDTLPADIQHWNTMETFPVLSYPMNSIDGQKTKAELFPPADPGRKFGLHGLGWWIPWLYLWQRTS